MTTTLSLEKLKDLWNARSSIRLDEEKAGRADDIFKTVDAMLSFPISEDMKANTRTALEDDCPVNNCSRVRDNIQNKAEEYFGTEGRQCVEIVWNKIAVIQSRKDWSRTASEAKTKSCRESTNTSPNPFSNTDSWFFSYNYPWHIVIWFQETARTGRSDISFSDWEENGEGQRYKYLLKYLWMLAKDADLSIVPILSLESFLNLIPVFRELNPRFDEAFGFDGNYWKMTEESFKNLWPDVSRSLIRSLVGKEQFGSKEEKRSFSKFLFVASLTDVTGRDLQTMLEGGNHAVILYGPPGTGKTFLAKRVAKRMIGISERGDDRSSDNGEYRIVQFHPNYTYQDFVGGIFPTLCNGNIGYTKRPGIFKDLCDEARKEENKLKKFVLIVDEINRADLSSVFGELLYGLEYRDEPMTIPVFDESFKIPRNVYLIGTMNNTDKSLIGFDLALRRRFGFIKVLPDMNVLVRNLTLVFGSGTNMDDAEECASVLFAKRAEKLNKGLLDVLNLSEDKQIGHAYFLKIQDFCTTRRLSSEDESGGESNNEAFVLTPYAMERLWCYHIEPLLEEYLGIDFEARTGELARLKTEFCKPFRD